MRDLRHEIASARWIPERRSTKEGETMTLNARDVDTYGLTDEERKRFDEDGFFMVAGALDPATVEALRAIADGYLDRLRATGADERAYLNRHDLVGPHPLFLHLMISPTVFP